MSVSTEVQRTLVKSPPELWAELSSPERLGRHFGEVGEIRVTKAEPECKVEWEADGAKGIVELEQSGWGTRVTLSLTRELPVEETPQAAAAPTGIAAPAPIAEPEPFVIVHPEPPMQPEPAVEPRPRFFARLFRRRRIEPVEKPATALAEAAPDVVALAAPEPTYPEPPPLPAREPASDLAAELAGVEAQIEEDATELLTGVLDRLGAAHHRPFSRG